MFQSLFCLKGQDTLSRFLTLFFITITITYLSAGIQYITINFIYILFYIIINILSGIILIATIQRRYNAIAYSLPPKTIYVFLSVWFCYTILNLYFPLNPISPILITIGFTVFLIITPQIRNNTTFLHSILGYQGPIYDQVTHSYFLSLIKQEPTLNLHKLPSENLKFQFINDITINKEDNIDIQWKQFITKFNQKEIYIFYGIMSIFLVLSFIFYMSYGTTNNAYQHATETSTKVEKVVHHQKAIEEKNNAIKQPIKQKESIFYDQYLKMPNEFDLYIYKDGLIIKWIGENYAQKSYWSLVTGEGNYNCAVIVFNNQTEYRVTKVDVLNKNEYYAYMSPLDTADLIYNIARRNTFQLCDYQFNLKGSLKILQTHPAFALYTKK